MGHVSKSETYVKDDLNLFFVKKKQQLRCRKLLFFLSYLLIFVIPSQHHAQNKK